MNTAASTNADGFASGRWLEANLGANWLRILDVRGAGSVRDDRSGPRLRTGGPSDGGEGPPRFVELGPRAGWLRAGTWPESSSPSAPFLQGHVPGSTSLDVGRRLFDETGALVCIVELAMAMSELGVGDEHTIVLVDESRPSAALVAAWALRRYGHPDTRILSGGFPRWLAEGRPVTRDIVRHPFASFTVKVPA
jgi:thiosulfate/3-mercaptopyruvate sulfurtransferase